MRSWPASTAISAQPARSFASKAYPLAVEYAEKALAIDDTIAESHVAKAGAEFIYGMEIQGGV